MEQKSKPISGLNYQKRRKVKFRFTDEEKHKIIKEFLNSDCTKREIWKKYTGEEEEHGQLLRWMRQLGYDSDCKNITFAPNIDSIRKFLSIFIKKQQKLVFWGYKFLFL